MLIPLVDLHAVRGVAHRRAVAARKLEAFPDTFNPGYFVIKLAVALLALLVLLQAIMDVLRPGEPEGS